MYTFLCELFRLFPFAHPSRWLSDSYNQVIYWLSGLTCTDENFVQKSFAQKYASEHGIALVCPDTSPRESDCDILR